MKYKMSDLKPFIPTVTVYASDNKVAILDRGLYSRETGVSGSANELSKDLMRLYYNYVEESIRIGKLKRCRETLDVTIKAEFMEDNFTIVDKFGDDFKEHSNIYNMVIVSFDGKLNYIVMMQLGQICRQIVQDAAVSLLRLQRALEICSENGFCTDSVMNPKSVPIEKMFFVGFSLPVYLNDYSESILGGFLKFRFPEKIDFRHFERELNTIKCKLQFIRNDARKQNAFDLVYETDCKLADLEITLNMLEKFYSDADVFEESA